MGFLHHSIFLQYFEIGRIELLRSLGLSYADLEHQGFLFAVVRVEIQYRAPAKFDDLLQLTTRLLRVTHVRNDHSYELKRGDILIAEGSTTVACIDREGKLQAIPKDLHVFPVD
jgi:acyl-CoA thioester hydrolase